MPDTQMFEILLAAVVAGIVLFRLYTVLAVSYTHLDVYKRQLPWIAPM